MLSKEPFFIYHRIKQVQVVSLYRFFRFQSMDRLFILLGTSGLCHQWQTFQLLIRFYFGSIDEFYVYNRELTSNDICVLIFSKVNYLFCC